MADKVSYAVLASRLAECPRAGTLWRHYKSGALYRVTGCCIREADQQPQVRYEPYGSMEESAWLVEMCRPLAEWKEFVPGPDGEPVQRFELVYG